MSKGFKGICLGCFKVSLEVIGRTSASFTGVDAKACPPCRMGGTCSESCRNLRKRWRCCAWDEVVLRAVVYMRQPGCLLRDSGAVGLEMSWEECPAAVHHLHRALVSLFVNMCPRYIFTKRWRGGRRWRLLYRTLSIKGKNCAARSCSRSWP